MDELVADSAGLADRITRASPTALEAAIATVGAPSVRARVPVDTGALRSSVATGKSGGHASGSAFLGMGEGLPYAGWIEYGGTRGRPYVEQGRYVYPAAQEVERVLGDAMGRATENEIRRYPWKHTTHT